MYTISTVFSRPPNAVMSVASLTMPSPCVIGCGSVHAAALHTNGAGMPQQIFIRKGFALRRRSRAKGRLPVSKVAVRPGNGLPPSEFRIPQGFAPGSTSKVHLGHQVGGELVVD